MDATTIFELAFGIGVIAGLRSLTAPTMVSWAARLGWLRLETTPLAFLGYAAIPYIFTVLALAELVADKLPQTPNRTAIGPLITRIVTGGLSGAAIAEAGGESAAIGALLGGIGGVAGAFGGYEARARLVKALKVPDIVIAVVEDLIAIGGGLYLVSRF
jgi:uncharacterized membrane protein